MALKQGHCSTESPDRNMESVMHEQMILILTCMLHVSVGLEKLQCQPKAVWPFSWREGEHFQEQLLFTVPV